MTPLVFEARFDGQVLRPETPVDLTADVIYTVTVASGNAMDEGPRVVPKSIWDVLDRHTGSVDGPRDWSAEHDHYLYGTPKRGGNEE